MNLVQWFKSKWQGLQRRRKVAREIHPEAFRRLATELRELARVAQQLWPQENKFSERIRGIQSEMEQLDKLAAKPEFRRLSPEKRLQLRQSLIESREQLMETVQTAPSPTARLQ